MNIRPQFCIQLVSGWIIKLLFFLHLHSKTKMLYYKLKLIVFYFLMVIIVLKLQSKETLILDLFCPWKYESSLLIENVTTKKRFSTITIITLILFYEFQVFEPNAAYRNVHCAICNNASLDKLICLNLGPFGRFNWQQNFNSFSFAVLFDISGNVEDKVGFGKKKKVFFKIKFSLNTSFLKNKVFFQIKFSLNTSFCFARSWIDKILWNLPLIFKLTSAAILWRYILTYILSKCVNRRSCNTLF